MVVPSGDGSSNSTSSAPMLLSESNSVLCVETTICLRRLCCIRCINEEGGDTGLHSRRWKGPISFQQLLIDFVILTTSSMVVRRVALDRTGWAALAVGNMNRHRAFPAYGQCQFPEACRLPRDGFRGAPCGFPTEIRN